MEHVDGQLAGVAGVELYWQGWLPGGAPLGVLLICPGMGALRSLRDGRRHAGARRLEQAVGTDDLTVRWYDGLWHEIYHEPERAQPLEDLREWLSTRVS